MNTRIPRTALAALLFLLFLALFRDVLSNGRPLYCKIGGESYFPGLRSIYRDPNIPFAAPALRRLQTEVQQFDVWKDPANFDEPPIYAPIPFSPGERSTRNAMSFTPPGTIHPGLLPRFRHWMGTDADGRDVAATLIGGARIALLTGALAMSVALLVGLTLGMLAGYFGDDKLRLRRGVLIMMFLGMPVAWFYGVTIRMYELQTAETAGEIFLSIGICLTILLIANRLGAFLSRIKWLSKSITLPADLIIMRGAELISAIPKLILLIVLAVALRGLSGEPIWLLIALIGALSWTGVAKFVRAELLRIRSLEYVAAAKGLGLPEWRVLLRHALPNAMRPVYIAFAFGASGAVLLEAYLSFLGFGGQAFRGVSWGSLFMNENGAANPLDTWWITIFPGMMIFITVLSLNSIGETLSTKK